MYADAPIDELIQAYTSMMDYSGRITPDMQAAIDARGGIEAFRREIDFRKRNRTELNRIALEVRELYAPGMELEFLKTLVGPSTLSMSERDAVVALEYTAMQLEARDRKVTSRTVAGSVAGALLGMLLGTAILLASVFTFGQLFYFILIPVYMVVYVLVKMITRQSRRNIAVFIASLAATLGAFVITLYILRP